uniref:Photosystem II 5 kDa protein n=1 Tax=Davidia involucrata TaxID=16924 RepID=A0A5B7CDM6_DAVIN
MASVTMTATFLGGSTTAAISKQPATITARRGVVMAKASKVVESEQTVLNGKEESNTVTVRRDLVFAAAAAAVCSIAKIAMADEPKSGTLEAKKKYAPVCVTMPTARICHK